MSNAILPFSYIMALNGDAVLLANGKKARVVARNKHHEEYRFCELIGWDEEGLNMWWNICGGGYTPSQSIVGMAPKERKVDLF